MDIKFDGMEKANKADELLPDEVNEDELIGYIMRQTSSLGLTYQQVKSVLDFEEQFLIERGFTEGE